MAQSDSDIRYVVLSDLHLGESISILTPLNPQTHQPDLAVRSPVLDALSRALVDLLAQNPGGTRPVFVLGGDILGLAHAPLQESLQLFAHFVGQILQPGREVVEKFIYLPGNHDHHIWELARQSHYTETLRKIPPGDPLPQLPHVTAPLPGVAIPSVHLQNMMALPGRSAERRLPVRFDVLYPQLVLSHAGTDRAVIIDHGHFVEKIYHFLSLAARALFPGRPLPESIAQIEKENFAWIDFVWSRLGSTGAIARDFERISMILHNPHDTRRYANQLAERMAVEIKFPFLPFRWMKRILSRKLIFQFAKLFQGERYRPGHPFSERTRDGLTHYFYDICLPYATAALGRAPEQWSFIWGHTHKPHELILPGSETRPPVASYNLGGWTMDPHAPGMDLGASVLFLNESLDVAALRIYEDKPEGQRIILDMRTPAGPPGSFAEALVRRLRRGEAAPAQPWQDLAEAIRSEIRSRRQFHREHCEK